MNIRKEIDEFSAKDDRHILHWLLDRYSWVTQWRFVSTCSFERYGTQSYEVNRVWSPTIEGRVLYNEMSNDEPNDELAELSILWNDLAMLIDAQECYNERYYNSEYKRIIGRINEIGGVK